MGRFDQRSIAYAAACGLIDEPFAATSAQDLAALKAVLAEAQNAPPEGASDGSLSEIAWTAYHHFAETIGAARGAYAYLVEVDPLLGAR